MSRISYRRSFAVAAGVSLMALSLALSLRARRRAGAASRAAPDQDRLCHLPHRPAAAPFGIPVRNSAEILVENLNAGKMPAPYNQIGLGGAKIEAKFIDETGSAADQVTQFRNLVERDHVDVVVGYVSSGNCLAIAPVAEELKQLTVFDVCGTPRIFEEKQYHLRVPRQPDRHHG